MEPIAPPTFGRSAAHRGLRLCALAGAAALAAACTTVGTGTGAMRAGGSPVSFHWTSKDGGSTGTMGASLPDGTAFSGPFLQLSSHTRVDALEPMWFGWHRGWGDWVYRGSFPDTAFLTHYSGKVVANLQGPGDQRMRCRFHLNSPQAGMGGGGQGECQLSTGGVVDAVFGRS